MNDERSELFFSALTIWETAIKSALQKRDFKVDARALRRGLLTNGYRELPITSEHAVAVYSLPHIHKDPFDRLLIAQATVEGITLLTADRQIAKYPGPIRKV
jgi:PIN domain nuclease of toxin-antitoxin system